MLLDFALSFVKLCDPYERFVMLLKLRSCTHHPHMHYSYTRGWRKNMISIYIHPKMYITILECSWARSARKLYDYSGVLLWIMSLTYGHNRTGTALYVARGGVQCSFIPCWVWRQWTWYMHCICTLWGLLELKFYVVMKWSEYSFYVYEEYCSIRLCWWFIYYIMLFISLWKFH
jgi:hypothetical protein